MVPVAGAFFCRNMTSEYHFPERGTSDWYVLRLIAVSHTGSRQNPTVTDVRERHGARSMMARNSTERLDGECDLELRGSAVSCTSLKTARPLEYYNSSIKTVALRSKQNYCLEVQL